MALEIVPCAICRGVESVRLYEKFGLPIARCVRCGLVFANPRISREEIVKRYSPEYFRDEYLPSHDVRAGRYSLEHFDRRYEDTLAWLARHVPPAPDGPAPRRLLEVGCGAGFFLKAAQRAGWHVCGVEISEAALRFAAAELELDVRPQAAEALDFPPASFDVVVLFEVIEHLLDPARALQAARRVVRPGGLLLLSTPNFNALSHWSLGREWAMLAPAEHLYYFTETSLRAIVEQAGWRDVRIVRRYPVHSPAEVMNARLTHAPQSWRARLYGGVVDRLGPLLYPGVQAWGRSDTLLCHAQA